MEIIFIISFNVICWLAILVGYVFIKRKMPFSKKIEKKVWNARIDKFHKFPFSKVMEIYENKRYFPTNHSSHL